MKNNTTALTTTLSAREATWDSHRPRAGHPQV